MHIYKETVSANKKPKAALIIIIIKIIIIKFILIKKISTLKFSASHIKSQPIFQP
jgi:hypothetical protein